MRAHFTAINSILTPHGCLDNGMAAPGQYRHAAAPFYNLLSIPKKARVMHYPLTLVFRQKSLCQKAYHIIAFDKIPLFIKEKASVKIAIPGNPQISSLTLHRLNGRMAIFRQQRIWYAIGEISIRLMIYLDKSKGQIFFQPVQNRSGRAIATVYHNL